MSTIILPELVGTLASLPEHTQKTIKAYGAACARTALQSQPRTEPSEWLKQHEALMHRVSKAAMVVGYGGTINGATAEQSLEHAEKTLLDHARSLQSQDREDALRYQWLRKHWFTMGSTYKDDQIQFYINGPRYSNATEAELDAAIDHARRVEGADDA